MCKRFLPFLLFILTGFAASAQAPKGIALLPADSSLFNRPSSAVQWVAVANQPFRNAYRISTGPGSGGNLTLRYIIDAAVTKGDVFLLSFYTRSIQSKKETGEAFFETTVDRTPGGKYQWPPLIERGLSFGSSWQQTQIPFVAEHDAAKGEAVFVLKPGAFPQVFEVGGISLVNYKQSMSLADLPRTVVRYGGDEPTAAWRKAAAERIEKHRKGNLSITVVDEKGKRVSGAGVSVRMKRNAFTWGTATSSALLLDSTSAGATYRDTLLKYFNQVVLENEIKSKNWERFDAAQTAKGVAWLKAQAIPVRGHVMVWPSWQHSGASFAVYKKDTTGLRAAILNRLRQQTAALKGYFTEWDVVNEPYAHDDFLKLLGREEMITWFNAAREGTPGVKLFLNDYTMFHGEGAASPSELFFNNVKFLLDNGAPVEAIGEQGHIGGTPPPIEKVVERLDRFAQLGLPIQISEFDINSNDDEFKARYLHDFMTAVYSHPSTIGFVQWGFWEGAHWFPVAALWDEQWKLRAHGKVYTDLVTKTWTTNTDGRTDKNGNYVLRAFTGDYEVVVRHSGKEVRKAVVLTTTGQTVVVKLADKNVSHHAHERPISIRNPKQ